MQQAERQGAPYAHLNWVRPALVYAHPDDAVLCASRALLGAAGSALDVVVCGGRPRSGRPGAWDRQCGFTSALRCLSSRGAEHSRVCRALRISSVALPLRDGQHLISAWARHSACTVLVQHCLDFEPDVVLTHRPDASHMDHRLAFTLASAAARELSVPLITTCDRPYLGCSPASCDPGFLQSTAIGRAQVLLTDEEWKAKLRLLRMYKSQQMALCRAFGHDWKSRRRLGIECYTLIANARP